MLKLRLKRGGRKRQPSYRIILIKSDSRRDGRPIENLGYYNPVSKQFIVDSERVTNRLNEGAQPTQTVKNLLMRAGIMTA
jgi:small subunit ribosomal protein S16